MKFWIERSLIRGVTVGRCHLDRCQVARIRLTLDGEHSALTLRSIILWGNGRPALLGVDGRRPLAWPSCHSEAQRFRASDLQADGAIGPLPITQLREGDEILVHWASSSPARVNHVHSVPSEK